MKSRCSMEEKTGFAAVLLVWAVLGVISYRGTHLRDDSFQQIQQHNNVLERWQILRSRTRHLESSLYSYMSTGRARDLDAYEEAAQIAQWTVRDLRKMTLGDRAGQTRLNGIDSFLVELRDKMDRQMTLREAGRNDAGTENLGLLLEGARSKPL